MVDRQEMLDRIQAKLQEADAATEFEDGNLSVNDWIDRVRGLCLEAHKLAREGAVAFEVRTWLDVAVTAIRRAEQVQRLVEMEEAETE